MVLAAMYMLRLISAVLHRSPGPAVTEAALDLRPAELTVIVPLVALLLVLSEWPAAITERSFASSPQIPNKGSVIATTEAGQLLMLSKELAQRGQSP